jgi:hypothetical protein
MLGDRGRDALAALEASEDELVGVAAVDLGADGQTAARRLPQAL